MKKLQQKKYQVLFQGDFKAKNVSFQEIPSSRKIDPALEEQCQEAWRTMLEKAKKEGKSIWDSEVYRFEKAELKKGTLQIEVSTIPFSVRYPMNKYTEVLNVLGPDYFAHGLYSSALVKTIDDVYCFIEKSDKYVSRKTVPFIGGVMSKSEKVIGSGDELFDQLVREIEEEIGVDVDQIKSTTLKAAYRNLRHNVCLVYEVVLDLAFDEVEAIFDENNDGEAARVIGVPEHELAKFIAGLEEADKIVFEILGLI